MLYELCLGRHPFDAGTLFTVIRNVVQGNYKRPRAIDENFPRVLGNLITSCLEVDPRNRPDGTEIVARELSGYMAAHGLIATMADIAQLARGLVTDVQGPSRFKPLMTEPAALRLPFGHEETAELETRRGGGERPATSMPPPPYPGHAGPGHAGSGHSGPVYAEGAEYDNEDDELTRRQSRPSTGRNVLENPSAAPRGASSRGESLADISQRLRDKKQSTRAPTVSVDQRPKRVRKGRVAVGIGLAVALSAAAVGVIYWRASKNRAETDAVQAASASVQSGKNNKAGTIHENFRFAQQHRVQLASEPAGAMVSIGGRIVGEAPLEVTVPADREGVIVTLRLPGYKPVERLVHESEKSVRVVLPRKE